MMDLTIYNFRRIDDFLGTSGMPERAHFAEIAQAGYQAVINLALDTSSGQLPDESRVVQDLGMAYIHIPVVWENPQMSDLIRFFQAMDSLRGQKVFVHCVANYRVSAFVYLYRSLRLGVPEEQARQDLHSLWTPDGIWAELIEAAQAIDWQDGENTI
jgi:protein tyrosine phosphatase (PTP) superfamily phosphohydrolase (DUF442 family)